MYQPKAGIPLKAISPLEETKVPVSPAERFFALPMISAPVSPRTALMVFFSAARFVSLAPVISPASLKKYSAALPV